MNDEVRRALFCLERNDISWHTINNELTRLTAIADQYDPLVVRLHDVTEKLERANALLREADPYVFGKNRDLSARIVAHFTTHLSEPRT